MTRARAMLSRLRGRNEVAYAVAAMALASAAAVVVLETWRAYFNAPFAYRDDSILNLMLVKSVLENSWIRELPAGRSPRPGTLRLPVRQR